MKNLWNASAFFQKLGDDIVDGQVGRVLTVLDTSIAIFTASDTYVYDSVPRMLADLNAFSAALRARGVARCRVHTTEQSVHRARGAQYDVRAYYMTDEGETLGESFARYYVTALDSRPKIAMVDVGSIREVSVSNRAHIGVFQ